MTIFSYMNYAILLSIARKKKKNQKHTNKQEIPFNKVVHLYSIFVF